MQINITGEHISEEEKNEISARALAAYDLKKKLLNRR